MATPLGSRAGGRWRFGETVSVTSRTELKQRGAVGALFCDSVCLSHPPFVAGVFAFLHPPALGSCMSSVAIRNARRSVFEAFETNEAKGMTLIITIQSYMCVYTIVFCTLIVSPRYFLFIEASHELPSS